MVAPIDHRRPWPKRSSSGPDQRSHDRERQHGQGQEQRHLAPRLTGRYLEEQGAGQGDRHGRVGGAFSAPSSISRASPLLSGTLGGGRAARRTVRGAADAARAAPAPSASPRPVVLAPEPTRARPRTRLRLPGRGHASILHGRPDGVRARLARSGCDLTGEGTISHHGRHDWCRRDRGGRARTPGQGRRRGPGRRRGGPRGAADRGRRGRGRRPPRRRGRGRPGGDPPVRVPQAGLRRLALVGDRRPRSRGRRSSRSTRSC